MRIHLGHHFYGAGNLGDDLMLAGFLGAMQALAPEAAYTSAVPFPLDPLRRRFPSVDWFPYDAEQRERAIARCDVWLGLGGSPFQSAQSRWFLDHLASEAALCRRYGKPMFFLGIGVQTDAEMTNPDVRDLCAQAAGLWMRDPASAKRIREVAEPAKVGLGADLAHLYFRTAGIPSAQPGRLTVTVNFDYAAWPGQAAFLRAADTLPVADRIWLAQESRELPGAEKALYAALPDIARAEWRLVDPEQPGAPLRDVLAGWPSGEWLVTARHHSAIAGAWAGAKVIVIETNAKLRAVAADLNCPTLAPDAPFEAVVAAFNQAKSAFPPAHFAALAHSACAEFYRAATTAVKNAVL